MSHFARYQHDTTQHNMRPYHYFMIPPEVLQLRFWFLSPVHNFVTTYRKKRKGEEKHATLLRQKSENMRTHLTTPAIPITLARLWVRLGTKSIGKESHTCACVCQIIRCMRFALTPNPRRYSHSHRRYLGHEIWFSRMLAHLRSGLCSLAGHAEIHPKVCAQCNKFESGG